MKKFIIIMIALLLSCKLYSQQNDFVQLDGKKFMLNCEEFYPKVMNFRFGVDSSILTGKLYITPYSLYRNGGLGIYDSCNAPYINPPLECRTRLKAQLQMVKDLGFNAIRLCGLEITTHRKMGDPRLFMHVPMPVEGGCVPKLLDTNDYNAYFAVIDSVLVVAEEVGLKVIYLVLGGGGVGERNEDNIEQLSYYLERAAIHFKNNTTLMAYDLYNEPSQVSEPVSKDTAYSIIHQFYRSIRDKAPNQLVTIGLQGYGDIYRWDPGILPVDFVSFHFYQYPSPTFAEIAPYFKWMGDNISKPWIIGETGYPSDSLYHINLLTGDTTFRYLYPQTLAFADTIKKCNTISGSSGFSWWMYQDGCLESGANLQTENYFGIMNRTDDWKQYPHYTQTSDPNLPRVDGCRKFPNTLFTSYNPGYAASTAPKPVNYYNFWNKQYLVCKGTVSGSNGKIKDAVVTGYIFYEPNNTDMDNPSMVYDVEFTFTNDTGYFELKSNKPQFNKVTGVDICYPSKEKFDFWPLGGFDTISPTLENFSIPNGGFTGEFNDFVVRRGDTLVWDNPMSIPGDIRILGGGQLTVKNTVFFNSGKKIIVTATGKLIVDGGKLTSGCDDTLWGGVELKNDCNQPQTKDYQGYIQLKDSATIENAEIGIYCKQSECTPADIEYDLFSGGVIEADTAFFINNLIGIKIDPFRPNTTYNSTIKNCQFLSDRNSASVSYVAPIHIKLNEIKGIAIYANLFSGNDNGSRTISGTGIEALDATFKFNNIWSTTKPNEFSDLTYGIKCMNSSGVYNPEISLTNFNNCLRAIYLSGVTDAKVLGDTINYKSQSTTSEAYGIYLDNCDGYYVEGNILSASDDNNKPEFGIIINNSGGNANKIYRNTFTKINFPLNAQNVNRNSGGGNGLELLCNNIIDCNTNDIIVTYESSNQNNGIKMNQGNYTDPMIPAGNLFTKGGKMYINYTNSSLNQVHYARYSQTGIVYYEGIPHYVTPKVTSTVTNHNTLIPWDSTSWVDNDCKDSTGLQGGNKFLTTQD
jgi:hypothetical protein